MNANATKRFILIVAGFSAAASQCPPESATSGDTPPRAELVPRDLPKWRIQLQKWGRERGRSVNIEQNGRFTFDVGYPGDWQREYAGRICEQDCGAAIASVRRCLNSFHVESPPPEAEKESEPQHYVLRVSVGEHAVCIEFPGISAKNVIFKEELETVIKIVNRNLPDESARYRISPGDVVLIGR